MATLPDVCTDKFGRDTDDFCFYLANSSYICNNEFIHYKIKRHRQRRIISHTQAYTVSSARTAL